MERQRGFDVEGAATGMRWVKVWDAPTRLFHWLLAGLIAAAYATAATGRIEWHFLIGYAILALVGFRILWGLVGSDTARFARFLRSPIAAFAHLKDVFARRSHPEAGHNAAGGWMVLALLALVLFQGATGLFATDGIFSDGPLARYAGTALSEAITAIHEANFNLLLAAVALHVLAVIGYGLWLRDNLLRPMVTGWKKLPVSIARPRMAGLFWAATALVASGASVWALATFA